MSHFRGPASLFCALFGLVATGVATPNSTQDLGQGLAYVRVHALADDAKALDEAASANGALVIDLRFATARPEDIALLERALSKHRGPELLCVLVSPTTPPAVAGVLSAATEHFTTLGVTGSVPSPKVVIEQTTENDRRAYEAFEAGTPLSNLISGKIEKDRYDEASLMNDFSNGNTSGEPPPPDPKAAKNPPKEPPLVDRVLQRAMNLHRALAAIKPRS